MDGVGYDLSHRSVHYKVGLVILWVQVVTMRMNEYVEKRLLRDSSMESQKHIFPA